MYQHFRSKFMESAATTANFELQGDMKFTDRWLTSILQRRTASWM